MASSTGSLNSLQLPWTPNAAEQIKIEFGIILKRSRSSNSLFKEPKFDYPERGNYRNQKIVKFKNLLVEKKEQQENLGERIYQANLLN